MAFTPPFPPQEGLVDSPSPTPKQNNDNHYLDQPRGDTNRKELNIISSDGTKTALNQSRPPPTHAARHSKAQQPGNVEHFSLLSWVRNAPWSKYFKDGCRLIVRSPFNFFIFFCCLSVVVWGAFLVLLMGNMVKLRDDATQKLWIEIASQVLNGFFTLANVPVHPKRLIGFIRGIRIWREDRAIRQEFVGRFLKEHLEEQDVLNGVSEQDRREGLLRRLDFYRCFPDYGRDRVGNELATDTDRQEAFIPNDTTSRGSDALIPTVTHVAVPDSPSPSPSPSQSRSKSTIFGSQDAAEDLSGHDNESGFGTPLRASIIIDKEPPPSLDGAPATGDKISVGIAEEELNGLLAEETRRMVHSVVLPFLPFPLGGSGGGEDDASADLERGQQLSLDTGMALQQMEEGIAVQKSPASPRSQKTPERGSSSASLTKAPTKRISPRTKARTKTIAMVKDSNSSVTLNRSTFVIHEAQGQPKSGPRKNVLVFAKRGDVKAPMTKVLPFQSEQLSIKKGKQSSPLMPMPAALTSEQMDWVDERQRRLLRRQERLQKAWPWYNYMIPTGVEPVDFFALPAQQSLDHVESTVGASGLPAQAHVQEEKGVATDAATATAATATTTTTVKAGSIPSSEEEEMRCRTTVMLNGSPMKLVVSPSRFCLIVGSFNLNSMIQEMLCGFMWGMNYHVRPGWVVGTGMALGCVAAIVPSVLIMLHEQAMGRIRVVATAEEAIQDVLDEKRAV